MMMTSRKSEIPDDAAPSAGFDEASARYDAGSSADVRFTQSVDLIRHFNLIEDSAQRQQVVELVRRLALGRD
jgi:hypothetical protein